jgi:hypothetical protein
MSLRRAVGAVRELSTTSRLWAYAAYAESGNGNGDPGPKAASFRKSQRKALRQEKSTRVVGGLDVLNGLLDPAPPPSRERSQRYDNTRERHERGPRRHEHPTRSTSTSVPDAYGTSIKLRKITKPRTGVMSPADLDKAINMVMDAPKSTVSTPVWNMLLGTIGRAGRLELMWKTFNDVSYRIPLGEES